MLVDILLMNKSSFFYRHRARAILFDGDSWEDEWLAQIWFLWNFIVSMAAHLWDFAILLLYLFKIWRIGKVHKSKLDGVWDHVLSILHRIVIITVFYTICAFFAMMFYNGLNLIPVSENATVNAIIYELRTGGLIAFLCVTMSFAIYLMMDHNTNVYIDFLHFLRRLRLKYLCICCCHRMVDQQIEYLDAPRDLELQYKHSDAVVKKQTTQSTVCPDASRNIGYTSDVFAKEMNAMSPRTMTKVVGE